MRLSLLVLSALALAGATRAQMFPAVPASGTVYDGAHLLTARDNAMVNALSRAFQRDTGAPIVVATLPSLQSVGAKGIGIERYSTMLFDQWRVGRREANGGILLVVAKADHKVRIELGKDWGHDYDAAAKRVREGTIVPAFKRGDYSGGILKGCRALARLASDPAPVSDRGVESTTVDPPTINAGSGDGFPGSEFPGPGFSNVSPSGGGLFDGGLLCFVLPVLFFVVVAALFGSRRRGYGRSYGSRFGNGGRFVNSYNDPNDDAGFIAGVAAVQAMSEPAYDPGPSYDPSPSYDSGPSFDSGSGSDSGSSSDSGGSFDSGSSGGGGDTGSW